MAWSNGGFAKNLFFFFLLQTNIILQINILEAIITTEELIALIYYSCFVSHGCISM